MKYEQINGLAAEKCRRLIGVKRKTFNKVFILKGAETNKKPGIGRKNKLSIAYPLLM